MSTAEAFKIYPTVVDILGEVAFIHKLLGGIGKLDPNIFGIFHWRVKIKIADVHNRELFPSE